MINTLVFDLDGTLADTKNDLADCVNYVLKARGFPPRNINEVIERVGLGLETLLKRCMPQNSGLSDPEIKTLMQDFKSQYSKKCCEKTMLYPGIRGVLESFKGLNLAVLTNKSERYSLKILRKLNIEGYFSLILCGDTVPVKKPDPSGLQAICDFFKVSPKQVLMIGDGMPDVRAAKKAGCRSLAITGGFSRGLTLRKENPDYILAHVRDALWLIRKLTAPALKEKRL